MMSLSLKHTCTHRQALEESDKEITAYQMQTVASENNQYQERLDTLRQRYVYTSIYSSVGVAMYITGILNMLTRIALYFLTGRRGNSPSIKVFSYCSLGVRVCVSTRNRQAIPRINCH